MAKKQSSDKYKIYAFMTNPHQLLIVSQDGQKLAEMEVENDVQAKEKLSNEQLNQDIIRKIKRTDFSTVWSDDPAGDPLVIDACYRMEQAQKKAAQDAPAEAPAETTAAQPAEEKPPVIQTIEAHTIGIIFQILQGDAWANIPGKLLKEGDICRLFPEREEPNEKEWILTAAPELVDEAADDWLIKLKAKEDAPATESQPAAAPQFKATDKKKMIDVECATTHSEEKIKTLVRGLQSIKAEAQADAADWRERIKTQEKALFEACNGKSFTQMECKIEEDWDAGVRRYVRPDTGEVALTEQIPYEERQLNMNLDGPAGETTAEALASDQDAEKKRDAQDVKGEQAAGNNAEPAPESDDFPPPDETVEQPQAV